jgi:osmotically-inducible protein OsmY
MLTRMCFCVRAALLLLVPVPAVGAQAIEPALGQRAVSAVRDYAHFTIFDDIDVACDAGVITLTGRVTAPSKRQEIGELVEKIEGVAAVRNRIQILPDSQIDARLRQQIARAIYDHPAFWRYASMSRPPIHIVVEDARVTLTGSVGSETERTLAYTLAQVSAAAGVTNRLKVDLR